MTVPIKDRIRSLEELRVDAIRRGNHTVAENIRRALVSLYKVFN